MIDCTFIYVMFESISQGVTFLDVLVYDRCLQSFGKGGIFIMPHLLWYTYSSAESSITTWKATGLKTYSYPGRIFLLTLGQNIRNNHSTIKIFWNMNFTCRICELTLHCQQCPCIFYMNDVFSKLIFSSNSICMLM